MIKAVIIGFAHMHVNEVALYISRHPEYSLEAAADMPSDLEKIEPLRYTPEWNKENIRTNFCPRIYEDYCQMLDEVKPEVAFILTENFQKKKAAEACAVRGINVILEKPMAVNLKEARDIEALAEKYGIEAYVNWPVMWRAYLYKMKNALDARLVGEPLKLRYINGHTGPLGKGARHRGVSANAEEMTDAQRKKTWWYQKKYGGGVFLDIGCYGCFFAKGRLGGGEKSAMAIGEQMNTPFCDTADNFAAVVRYDKKMAVLEGTWTTPRAAIPSGPMVMCTDGIIACTGGAENRPGVEAFDLYGNPVEVPEISFGPEMTDMPHLYAWHKQTKGEMPPMATLSKNVEIMAMLEAIISSAESKKEERIRV